jgi:outer membrane protein insertion porin family
MRLLYINHIENDSIYLDLDIKELPKLAEVKFVGVRKNKTSINQRQWPNK